MTFNPSAQRAIPGLFENAGTFIHAGDFAMLINVGTRFDNLATGDFQIQTTLAMPIHRASSGGSFQNFGAFRKASSGTSTISFVPFANRNGTLDAQQGTLILSATGSVYSGGHFTGLSGGTIQISGTSTWDGTFTGAGAVTGAGAPSFIVQNTPTIAASGVLFNISDENLMNWQAGASSAGGAITVAAGSYLKIGGGASQIFTNRIDVYGTLTRTGSLGFFVNTPGVLNVQPGGTFVIDTTGNVGPMQGSGTVNVYGVFRKVSTDNSSFASGNNFNLLGGTIDAQAGTLDIGGTTGSFENGQLNAASGATLRVSGPQTWKGTFTGSGAGTVNRANSFNIDASGVTLNFPSGLFNLSGVMTIGGPGVLSIAPGSFVGTVFGAKIVNNRFDIYGTLVATNNSLNLLVNNPGTVTVKSSGLITSSGTNNGIGFGGFVGSTAGSLRNEGTIRATAGSTSLVVAIPFDNLGTVDVQAGASLTFSHAIAQQPGTILLGGTWNVSGSLNFSSSSGSAVTTIGANATVTLNGASASFGRLEFNNPLQNNQGQLTIRGGKNFAPNRLFSNSGTVTIESSSTLTVPIAVPTPTPTYTQTSGSTVLNGGTLSSPALILNGGTIRGSGTILSTVTNNSGNVAPGASPGVINVTGNYTQGAAGVLTIEVGGTSTVTPDFDRLLISGLATLGGTLNVSPTSALPTITQPVTIDAYAQLGASLNTLAVGSNAVLKVELNGTSAGAGFINGLNITAPNSTIKGLVINRFTGNQVQISGGAATTVVLVGNYIGTNIAGDAPLVNLGVNTFSSGISISGGAHNNRIGTNGDGTGDFGERNLVSGNRWVGVNLDGAGTDSNVVAGNYIGLSASGMSALPNGHASQSGANIRISTGAKFNRIGSDGSIDAFNFHERNLISGQVNGHGVTIEGTGTDSNMIAGNYLGLNALGDAAIPNAASGVSIGGGGVFGNSRFNRIGISVDGIYDDEERNIISGNLNGVTIFESPDNTVAGNYIGTTAAGSVAIGNQGYGLLVADSADTIIGGSITGAGNVISGSSYSGVTIIGAASTGNRVEGNLIGTDKTGNVAFANLQGGVAIIDAPDNFIGGTASGAGNLISGNVADGVYLQGSGTTNNRIEGNRIGTDLAGMSAIPNGYQGVTLNLGAHNNFVGGNAAGAGNLISGNAGYGIQFVNANTNNNQVKGNRIGVNATGLAALSNGSDGVVAKLGASFNIIGGTTEADRNVISGNAGAGIAFLDAATISNEVQGNFIGVDILGTNAIGNAGGGVRISNASATTIGGPLLGTRNIISGNLIAGVWIDGVSAINNTVLQNYIGTDKNGAFGIPNPIGVLIENSANQNDIGLGVDWPNLISGNSVAGIKITGSTTQLNSIAGNTIGLSASNTALGNAVGVLVEGAGDSNTIGGFTSGLRNTISGNQGHGVWMKGGANGATTIANNFIGLNPAGTLDRGNQASGVLIESFGVQLFSNTISGNSLDGVEVLGTAVIVSQNRIGLDVTGSLIVGNDRLGVWVTSDAGLAHVTDNVISGNSAGIRNDGDSTTIKSNFIGTNASGLKSLGNRRGSGTSTDGHHGILSTGANAQIGDTSAANIIVGHDTGIWLKDVSASGVIRNNQIGTDAAGLLSMPNTIGIKLSDGAHGLTLDQNVIANSLTAGLRLLDGTSNLNTFTGNRYFGNLGQAIDGGAAGSTINDLGDTDGLLNFPVLEYADIVGDDFVVRGYVAAGRILEFYVSTPTVNSIGQGSTRIGLRTEGIFPGQDFDLLPGSYGPFMRGAYVGSDNAERFEFRFPLATLPPELRYGSLVTAVTIGSTSEFGNAISIGDSVSRLAPVIILPPGVNLVQGDSLRVDGSFRDDDSTNWTMTVDYGDGTGPQPLSFTADHAFLLEHEYTTVSTAPFQVIVTAIDNDQAVGSAVMGVIVSNEPPEVTFNQFDVTSQVIEGQVVTLTGNFSDSGANDTHTVTIDWGDGTVPTMTGLPIGARSFSSPHVYPDDDVSNTSRDLYRVIVTVADDHSGFSTTPDGLFVVEVINSLPTAPVLTVPESVLENQLFAIEGKFDDIGLLDTHRVTIDWGDDSPKETATVDQLISNPVSRSFTVLHRYADNPDSPASSFTISVEVADDDDPLSPVITTRSIIVTNETPLVTSIVPSSISIDEGSLLSLNIGIDDSGSLDSHQVVIDWGDGSEVKVYDLAPAVLTITGASHGYLNDPVFGSLYTIVVQVRDKDMASGTFTTDSRSITVNNIAPVVDPLKLFTRDAAGKWVERLSGYAIHEGDEVKITGRYADPGIQDTHSVQVQWAIGQSTAARVSNSAKAFVALFRYTDDFAAGTSYDDETIAVTVTDSDGLAGIATTNVRVENVTPIASYVPEVVTDLTYNHIPLLASAVDPGADTLVYSWIATVGTTTIQTGTGTSFVLDRTNYLTATIVVSLDVTDGDLGIANYTSAFKFGSSASETIAVVSGDFPMGVTILTVLGLEGDDIIDATAVTAPNRVILDGGDGQDYLYGGGGDDIYILRAGNDAANVDATLYPPPVSGPPIPPITPNYFGNDRYLLKPNSTLTVVDLEGDNSLDYSLASFGITFNLDTTSGTTLVSQQVALGGHFVAAVGDFNELIGTDFPDQLTGASNATVAGGVGADKLFAIANTTNARFFGDEGADEFTTSGVGLSEISFEGDDGADVFTNMGELTDIIFTGGADADLFTNAGTILAEISFEGDDGADVFTNLLGASIVNISFEGDAGLDRFINRGTITNVDPLSRISGDDGADVFENYGSLSEIIFTGGADADLSRISEVA